MKDFDIAKFLRENQLGSYGILNHYVDIKPLKEEFQLTPDQQRILNQKEEQWREFYKAHDEQHGDHSPYRMPYYSEESFIDAMKKQFIDILKGGGDVSNLEEMEDGAYDEQDEIPYEGPDPKLDGFGDEFEQEEPVSEEWHPDQTFDAEEMISSAITKLTDAGVSIKQIKQFVDKQLVASADSAVFENR